ncbi:cytochrome P450 [Aspergillus pseudodeflectus]|uniref:Cytochrome P450 n=1 Tax=Aspergillus pseudodeflectus TaxID=176178 RepID=A0ABR4JG48_9EURO
MYSHYQLLKHPDILANVREEHDEILGTDLTKTATRVRQRPELLTQLPYRLAVIKEALRLFHPADGIRDGDPDVSLCDPDTGIVYPTNGCAIWILHHAVHRNVNYWPYPDSFIPDRWVSSLDTRCIRQPEDGDRSSMDREAALDKTLPSRP